ncbi:hypothetical protein ABLO07_14095 [Mycobacterium tuberculosis]
MAGLFTPLASGVPRHFSVLREMLPDARWLLAVPTATGSSALRRRRNQYPPAAKALAQDGFRARIWSPLSL